MKKKEQKLSRRAFLKAAGVTLALGSCAPLRGTSQQPTSSVPLKNKSVDLSFWVIPYWSGRTGTEEDGKEADYYNWQIEEFKKEFPNVAIDVQFVPSTFEGWAKFDTAVAAGQPPDVMWGQAGNQWKYAPQDAIEPFDEWMDTEVKSDLLDSLAPLITYVDDNIYLWPYGMAVAGGVFANRNLFRELGAENLLPDNAERSWTVGEFEEALKATTQEIDGTQVYGTALMTDWSYQINQFLYGFGANLYNEHQTEMVMNSPEGVEALQWLVDLEHEHGWCAPGSAGRTNDVVLRLFQEQKIALYPSQPYYITAFSSSPDLMPEFEWVFCQPPHKEGHKAGAEANVHGYLVSKQQDRDKLAVAMKFVEHLTRPESLEIAAWAQGVVPPRESMLSILEGDENRYVEGLLAADAKPWGRLYNELGPKVLTPMYDAALSTSKTPETSLNDGVTAGNEIIQDAAEKYGWPT